MIKLVAFDWNGTIISDTKACWESSNHTFEKMGLKPISLLHFQHTFAIPITEFYEAHGLKKEILLKQTVKQSQIFNTNYEERIKNIRSRSGIKEVLKWLQKNNISAIIYSNHTLPEIFKHLKRLCIDEYFHQIVCNENAYIRVKQRSKEGKLQQYMEAKGYKQNEVISVGDTCEEIEIGQTLGLHTVALTGGCNSTKRLKACKPDFLIHNLKDLIPIIKKLNTQ